MRNIDNLISLCGRNNRTLHAELLFCMMRDMKTYDQIPAYIMAYAQGGTMNIQTLMNYTYRTYTPAFIKQYVTEFLVGDEYMFHKDTDWLNIPLVSKKVCDGVIVFAESLRLYHWLKAHIVNAVNVRYKSRNKFYINCLSRYKAQPEHSDLFVYLGLMRVLDNRLNLPNAFTYALRKNVNFNEEKEKLLLQRMDWKLIQTFMKKEVYGLKCKDPIQCKTSWTNIPLTVRWVKGDYELVTDSKEFKSWCNKNLYIEAGNLQLL